VAEIEHCRYNAIQGRNRKISAFFLHYSEIMLKFAAVPMPVSRLRVVQTTVGIYI